MIRVEIGKYEVVGHQVEVNHPFSVEEREALENLGDQPATFFLGERIIGLGEPLKEVAPAKVLGDDDGLQMAVDNSDQLRNMFALLQSSQQLSLWTACKGKKTSRPHK